MNFDTQRGHVLLLELSRQMTLDKGSLRGKSLVSTSSKTLDKRCDAIVPATARGAPIRSQNGVRSFCNGANTHFTGTAIADKHELEGRALLLSHGERSVSKQLAGGEM